MVITFDPNKDKLNQRKHGVSLAAAAALDWDYAVIWPDQRYHYNEVRECGVGLIGQHLYFIVFIAAGDVIRVISLRRANKREVLRYALQKP